jgi:hypothetical protein
MACHDKRPEIPPVYCLLVGACAPNASLGTQAPLGEPRPHCRRQVRGMKGAVGGGGRRRKGDRLSDLTAPPTPGWSFHFHEEDDSGPIDWRGIECEAGKAGRLVETFHRSRTIPYKYNTPSE